MSSGCVYLVGAGPGDPGLITVTGRARIERADTIVYDYLASPRLLAHARPDAERIYVGKQAGAHTLSQDEINALLVKLGRSGKTVVRLKGGDPFVFGRGGEEALALAEAGIAFEVVPGVTAGVAAPAYAGIPVTHRHMAANLGLVTGHEDPDKPESDLDYAALAAWRGTLVFYMGVKNLPKICSSLIENGLPGDTPAAIVRWGTTSRQEVVVGTVRDLPDRVAAAGIKPPAVTVIGQVAQLREKLVWFDRRPLLGRRIVVTRARRQASGLVERLDGLGAEVIEMPTIRIAPAEDPAPLREAVAEVERFDWIVLTSVNGVEAFFAALADAGKDSRALAGCKVCAIGPATRAALAAAGIRADAQPAKFVSSEIAATLAAAAPAKKLAGAEILCPRADIAPKDLIDDLTARGASVREVTAYRTVCDTSGAEQVRDLLADDQIHWITFTSSSTVKNFFTTIDAQSIRSARSVRLVSIGPVTSDTIRTFGFEPAVEADPHTIDGLVRAILVQESNRKNSP